MASTDQDLCFEALRGQYQFAYFQLGGAASAIAFAIHETEGQPLATTPWLLGAAVFFWAISFALGCFGVTAHHRALSTNIAYLRAFKGVSMSVARQIDADLVKKADDKLQEAADRPISRFRWQLWTLFAGSIAFIGGHIVQMAHTPVPVPASSSGVALKPR